MNGWYLTHQFQFEGLPVRYDIKGTGEPVVVVHGTPWSSYNLRHIIDALAAHYQVYYFDLLGYGQSSKEAPDVSLGVQNRVLDALLSHWGIASPIAIGHDFGGTTVLRTQLLNDARFKKIVLIDPVALRPWGSDFYRLVAENENVFSALPANIHEALVREYVRSACYSSLDKRVWDQTVSYWLGKEGQQSFYRQIAQSGQRYTDEVQDRYGEIDVETLVLWGKEDAWIPVEKGQELVNLLPNAEFHSIKNTGHLVIEEQPKLVVGFINEFLRK